MKSFLAISPLAATALNLSPALGSGGVLKTLDLLFYLLLALGIVLVIGIILVFIWEYRKFRRLFEQHKFL